jgi:glycosyltransferase involved in cell wall biosynthesis
MTTKFSIVITTKNRLEELKITLAKISYLLDRDDLECLIYDDGSIDGTYEFVKTTYPKIQLLRNEKSKGLIHNRNVLLNTCKGAFAISLDDDAHFITQNPLEEIENYFNNHSNCAVIALRIFWGIEELLHTDSVEVSERVKSFVGCAHVWRMNHWRLIPNYPEWFEFYGEEDFASYQLFLNDLEVHYLPEVLVNHRVEVKIRKHQNDYTSRLRKSLRAGWYLYFMFYPWAVIPRKMLYSIGMQFKLKVFKGDFRAFAALILALFDLIIHLPKTMRSSNRFSKEQMNQFQRLQEPKIYWNPKKILHEKL